MPREVSEAPFAAFAGGAFSAILGFRFEGFVTAVGALGDVLLDEAHNAVSARRWWSLVVARLGVTSRRARPELGADQVPC